MKDRPSLYYARVGRRQSIGANPRQLAPDIWKILGAFAVRVGGPGEIIQAFAAINLPGFHHKPHRDQTAVQRVCLPFRLAADADTGILFAVRGGSNVCYCPTSGGWVAMRTGTGFGTDVRVVPSASAAAV